MSVSIAPTWEYVCHECAGRLKDDYKHWPPLPITFQLQPRVVIALCAVGGEKVGQRVLSGVPFAEGHVSAIVSDKSGAWCIAVQDIEPDALRELAWREFPACTKKEQDAALKYQARARSDHERRMDWRDVISKVSSMVQQHHDKHPASKKLIVQGLRALVREFA
jgi:hypothetical protein